MGDCWSTNAFEGPSRVSVLSKSERGVKIGGGTFFTRDPKLRVGLMRFFPYGTAATGQSLLYSALQLNSADEDTSKELTPFTEGELTA